MREVIIEVKPDGTVKIDAVGYEGPACEKATEMFRVLLSQDEQKEVRKPSYYKKQNKQQEVQK